MVFLFVNLILAMPGLPAPPLPGKLTRLHPDHFFHQGACCRADSKSVPGSLAAAVSMD
jgi:hypothetical protein